MDMLVKLYALPHLPDLSTEGVLIRAPIGPEYSAVRHWVAQQFGEGWASEADAALGNRPASLLLACTGTQPVGFACYDATALGFLGPIGLVESQRRKGIGAQLLRATLARMRAAGYGYAIIGGVGVPEFFARVAGAIEIADSSPGIYADQIRH